MRRERVSLVPGLRWLAIFAGALLLGFGLCGLNVHLLRTSDRGDYFTIWGMFGLGLIILSAIGFVISGLLLLIQVLDNWSASK